MFFSEFWWNIKEIVKNKLYKMILAAYELFLDMITPIVVLRILKGISKHGYMLESIVDAEYLEYAVFFRIRSVTWVYVPEFTDSNPGGLEFHRIFTHIFK